MTRFPLVRLLGRRPGAYLGLVGLWTFLRLVGVAGGLLLQAFFDRVDARAAGWVVAAVLAGLALTEAVRLVTWYAVILSRVEPRYTYGIRAGLQHAVLVRLLRRPAAAALRRPVGDVVSRFSGDVDEVGVFAIWSASNISRLVAALAALAIMLRVSVPLTLALIAPVVAVSLLSRYLSRILGRYRAAAREAAAEVSTLVADAVGAISTVKAAGAEARVTDRLRRVGAARRTVAVREEILTSLQDTLFRVTSALAVGVVLLLAGGRMRAGTFSVGDLALFVFYIGVVGEAVEALGGFFARTRRAALSQQRLGELVDTGALVPTARTYLESPPPGPPPAPARVPLRSLEVTRLSSVYASGGGVRDVDLTLPAGALTVVTGGVGAGKTTLLRAVAGLLPAQGGQIRWNGAPVDDPAAFFVPPRAAFVPQEPRLFSGSLRDNVRLGLDVDDEAVLDALRRCAFGPDLATMPDRLDTTVGPAGMRLSGGQVQRVAAARLLVRDPELMIFDDVSNALDPETTRAVWLELRRDGRTILAVSHHPGLIAAADQVVVLADGGVVSAGPPARTAEVPR